MDSARRSAQVERLEVASHLRTSGAADRVQLKIVMLSLQAPGRGDCAATRCFALVAAGMAKIVSPRAADPRCARGLRSATPTVDQFELQLADLEENTAQAETGAQMAVE
jgi:hypothetical protein